MRTVVGLGNPGGLYAETRHNLGFMVLDALASRPRLGWLAEPNYRYALATYEGQEVALVKPMTFMNGSGMAVANALAGLEAEFEDLLLISDDVHLPLGRLRIRRGGSHGGHNGIRSVIQDLGTEAFSRVRLGIGPASEGEEMVSFVLEPFAASEHQAVSEMVGRAADAVRVVLRDGLDRAMNEFNR